MEVDQGSTKKETQTMTDQERQDALKTNADALTALNATMTRLTDERWALLQPTDEEAENAADMAEEDARDSGLQDSVSDAYWRWVLCDQVEFAREDAAEEEGR